MDCKTIKKIFKVWRLKRRADKLAKKTGDEYFVVMWHGKPRVLSKPQFKYLRQHGLFPLSFTAAELKKIAVYHVK